MNRTTPFVLDDELGGVVVNSYFQRVTALTLIFVLKCKVSKKQVEKANSPLECE